VALLVAEPDLGRHIAPAELELARRAIKVPVVTLRPGDLLAEAMRAGERPFAAMILTGLVAREIQSLTQPTLRLLGPGDLIHPPGPDAPLLFGAQVWAIARPTTLAIFDDHLLRAVGRWPRLLPALLERANENHDITLLQLVIAEQPRVEDRLVMLFRMLAGRWGRMTAEGIVVPIALTHEALGRLIGARRPTITLALRRLADHGRLVRRPRTGWLLLDAGEELAAQREDPGASRPGPALG
jgi:CRP-like cAMP-binding protein